MGLKPGQTPELIDSSVIAYNFESKYNGEITEYDDQKTWKTFKTDCFVLTTLDLFATWPYKYDKGTFCDFLKLTKTFSNKMCYILLSSLIEPRVCQKHWEIISNFNPSIIKCRLNVMENTHLISNTVCAQKVTFPNRKDSIQLFAKTLD